MENRELVEVFGTVSVEKKGTDLVPSFVKKR